MNTLAMKLHFFLWCLALHQISSSVASALENTDQSPAPSVAIAPDGTVRVTRVVPVSTWSGKKTISLQLPADGTLVPEAVRRGWTVDPA